MSQLVPFNLKSWIDDHRDLLKPPVGNAQIWEDTDFIVTVIGGPNRRDDYHVDPLEEFFYQIEGDMVLRVREDGALKDLPIREGEILLLPPHVPHSPQRPEGTIGMVIERQRPDGLLDAFEWYCESCQQRVHRHAFRLASIVDDFPPIFDAYYGSIEARTCPACGHVNAGKTD